MTTTDTFARHDRRCRDNALECAYENWFEAHGVHSWADWDALPERDAATAEIHRWAALYLAEGSLDCTCR